MNDNFLENNNEHIVMFKGEDKLYHSSKNKQVLPKLIPISIFIFFCKSGYIVVILMWISYAIWCCYNNRELDNDPLVLKKREEYNRIRRNAKESYEKRKNDPEFQESCRMMREILENERYKNL